MSSDLSPEAKGLLAVAQGGEEMPAADKARHRKQLLAQIAVASAAGAGATLAAKSAAAAKGAVAGASAAPAAVPIAAGVASAAGAAGTVAGVSILTKIAGVVVMAGVIGGGAIGVKSLSSEPVARVAAAPAVATSRSTPTHTTPTQAAATESPIQPSASTNEAPRQPAAPPVPSLVDRKSDTPATAASTSNPKPRQSSLEDETRLLRGAHEALESGNASRALAMLDEHARSYPHGVLVEERGAQRIFALCALGSTARARSEAAIFLSERPNSPLATRVRNSCIAK